ncbi:hypothetical protein RS130_11330 [Paraglaciecola aquimarina]|uniref:Solute-binding protein family 3/N-terminal domain-containing protein n=1 Tax=Paraglaciecola aquimarina TaxID=1235557 RepID=A0ABU3SWR1_9ALTE|nr:hypothetical protein [Paraglaciecola aquimarina]MDU0354446.1 hypothetical protein [Paraglaciecola aquimarina]
MKIVAILTIYLILALHAFAKSNSVNTLRVGIAYLPNIAAKKSDPLPVFMQRLADVSDVPMDINIYPFPRSIDYLNRQKIDIHLPMIESPFIDKEALTYQFSDIALWNVNFVIYSHKDTIINLNELSALTLYTDRAHTHLFPFKVFPIGHIEGAIQMVDKNRIDGLIFADTVIDDTIIQYNLVNIRRTLYGTFPVKFIVPKGQIGDEINEKLRIGMNILRARGEIKPLSTKLSFVYDDWQPYLMNSGKTE